MKALEIGAGPNPKNIEWDTLDIVGEPTYLTDMRAVPYPIEKGTYDLVYASHCLEHISWYDVQDVLREWRRILSDEGTLEIWVPDFAQIVKCYLYKEAGDTWLKHNEDADFMTWVNGRLYAYGEEENFHRCMFDVEYLRRHLERAGFSMIRELRVPDANYHGKAQFGMKARKMSSETARRIRAFRWFKDAFNYDHLLTALREQHPFAYVRYGDGELNCMFGVTGKNINGEHTYLPDMSIALWESFASEPDYHVGIMDCILNGTDFKCCLKIQAYLQQHPDLEICSSLLLHRASIHGEMDAFFEALKGKRVVMVGPERMTGMAKWLKPAHHIVVPNNDCWNQSARIEGEIADQLVADVFLFCCSMPSKVWIRNAWAKRSGSTFVDVGSAFDPYIGIKSRRYMRRNEHVIARRVY